MEHFYQLSALKDGVTLQSGIRDCMTKKPLKAGSRIVVCSKCRLAGIYLAENWSGSCVFCQGTETMEFPQGMDAVFHAHHSSSAGGYDAKPEAKDEKPRSKDEKSAPSPDEKKPKNGSSETDPRRRISPRTMMIGGGVLLAVLLILALIIRGCSQSEEPADTGAASFHQREVNSSEAESTTEASSRAAESSESSVLETAPLTDAAAVAAKSGEQVQSQSSASQTKPSLSSVIPSDAVSFGGHSYKYYSISLSWTEAEKYCTGLGGHLISINSADEQSFAEQLSSGAEAVNIWIGGYRLPNDGWAWSDGSVFSYTNWDIYPDAEGEMYIKPDNYWGNEDYIRYSNYSMTYDEWVANKGKWDDTANRADGYSGDVPISSFGFICEWGG